jgi:hypothetical protein
MDESTTIVYNKVLKKLSHVNVYSISHKKVVLIIFRKFLCFKFSKWDKDSVFLLKGIDKKVWNDLGQTLGRNFNIYVTGCYLSDDTYWTLDSDFPDRSYYYIFVLFSQP